MDLIFKCRFVAVTWVNAPGAMFRCISSLASGDGVSGKDDVRAVIGWWSSS
jgi:hypothetical protein